MLKATVERRYKDRDGQWKSLSSFSRNEIPLAIFCMQRCFEHIIASQQGEDGSVEEETVYQTALFLGGSSGQEGRSFFSRWLY